MLRRKENKMEDWMRRRIAVFKREKERSIIKLSGKAIQACRRDLPYTVTLLSSFMWMDAIRLAAIRQFEEWYNE